jgi:hypothetical protein
MRGHLKSKSVNDCTAFYSSLKQPFPVLRFLFAAVKHKRFASDGAEVSSVIEWLGYTKALKPLMALLTMRVFISCVSSYK